MIQRNILLFMRVASTRKKHAPHPPWGHTPNPGYTLPIHQLTISLEHMMILVLSPLYGAMEQYGGTVSSSA